MTLVEVMVAFAVLTISVYMVSSTIASASLDRITKRQTSIAAEAARSKLESLHADAFAQVFARFNDDPSDDPGAPGTAPGSNFAVQGLSPVAGDADGMVGKVVFSEPGPALHENITDVLLGLPRDLSGDIKIDGVDHAHDYIVLPVGVRIEWESPIGKRKVEMFTMLAGLAR